MQQTQIRFSEQMVIMTFADEEQLVWRNLMGQHHVDVSWFCIAYHWCHRATRAAFDRVVNDLKLGSTKMAIGSRWKSSIIFHKLWSTDGWFNYKHFEFLKCLIVQSVFLWFNVRTLATIHTVVATELSLVRVNNPDWELVSLQLQGSTHGEVNFVGGRKHQLGSLGTRAHDNGIVGSSSNPDVQTISDHKRLKFGFLEWNFAFETASAWLFSQCSIDVLPHQLLLQLMNWFHFGIWILLVIEEVLDEMINSAFQLLTFA